MALSQIQVDNVGGRKFPFEVSEQLITHLSTPYPESIQQEVGAGRTRVLVHTKWKINFTDGPAQHLLSHRLTPLRHIHDDQAGFWIIVCETGLGDIAVQKVHDMVSCSACSEFVERVSPDSVLNIPTPGMPTYSSKIGASKPTGPTILATIKNTLQAIGVDKVWNALGTPPFGGDAGGCPGINAGWFDTGAPQVVDIRFWKVWDPQADPATATRVVYKKSFAGSETDPTDLQGHGTRTLAIGAGQGWGDGDDYKGILYRANIYIFKVLNSAGSGLFEWFLDAVIDSRKYPLDVCNMSAGGPQVDPTLEAAINSNVKIQGQIWAIASGNDGRFDNANPHASACDRSLDSPGSAQEVFACGASDAGNEGGAPEAVQTWSSRPPARDGRNPPDPPRGTLEPITDATAEYYLCAPGVGIETRNGEGAQSGTSFAAPHVCGVAGQIVYTLIFKQGQGNIRGTYALVQKVRELILKTPHELTYWTGGSQNWTQHEAYCIEGWGRVDAWAAYQAAVGGAPPPTRKGAPSKSDVKSVIVHPKPPPPPPSGEPTTISTSADRSSYTSGDTVNISVKLTFTSDGVPLAGRQVAITFGTPNLTVPKTTDANGVAVASFTAPDVSTDTQVPYFAQFLGD